VKTLAHQFHLTDDIPIAFFLYNRDYAVIDCNRAAVNIFARDKGRNLELVRAYLISHARYIYPNYKTDEAFTEQVIRGACKQALKEGLFQFEHTFLTLSGATIPCEVTIVPVRLDDGQGYIHYLRELHDHQRVQEEMRRREAAEEANRAKSRFLARMSHEIRTPMHAVLGIAELLMQRDDLPPEIFDALTQINSSSSLLIATLDDILDLAKVEAGKLEIMAVPFETTRLIIDTVQLNQVHKNTKDLDFNISVDAKLPRRLIGDALRIRQIINNLLSNAFKYTRSGSVTLAFKYDKNKDEPAFCFSVKDTGQGMTFEQQSRLFDTEFTRFNAQANQHIAGSGLGMSVVKQLLVLMDGEVTVESEPNTGTEITVSIPMQAESNEILGAELAENLQDPSGYRYLHKQLPPTKKPEKIDRSPMPYGKVLVVDDVESNIYVAQGILEHYEINVDTAVNGIEAVEKIKTGAVYDIIFMDQMMPEMDGDEATKIIRESGYVHPVIALTANIVDKKDHEFTEKGYDGFIGKPIEIEQIERSLKRYIRDKYASTLFAPVPVTKPVVLIIDDAPAALTLLNDILKPYYRVLAARSGQAGLAVMEKQKVDLVLLDITMPGLSGFDVLERLSEAAMKVPVILVSASEQPQDQIRGMLLGAVDFLRKPFDKQTVLKRVKLHVGSGDLPPPGKEIK
jgi:signal transduction histidine kinase/CheY-like chemotaxis protein